MNSEGTVEFCKPLFDQSDCSNLHSCVATSAPWSQAMGLVKVYCTNLNGLWSQAIGISECQLF